MRNDLDRVWTWLRAAGQGSEKLLPGGAARQQRESPERSSAADGPFPGVSRAEAEDVLSRFVYANDCEPGREVRPALPPPPPSQAASRSCLPIRR